MNSMRGQQTRPPLINKNWIGPRLKDSQRSYRKQPFRVLARVYQTSGSTRKYAEVDPSREHGSYLEINHFWSSTRSSQLRYSAVDWLSPHLFSTLTTWGKRSQTKCKLCGNYETLLHVLNNCTVSLNQGRYIWRHNSILKHILTALKDFIEPTNNDLSLFSDIGG